MKTTIKRENYQFRVKSLQHVPGLKVVENRPGTPKLWAIAHENGHKLNKRRVIDITIKHGSGLKVARNCPKTIKLRAIAHKKTQKRLAKTQEKGHKHENNEF